MVRHERRERGGTTCGLGKLDADRPVKGARTVEYIGAKGTAGPYTNSSHLLRAVPLESAEEPMEVIRNCDKNGPTEPTNSKSGELRKEDVKDDTDFEHPP